MESMEVNRRVCFIQNSLVEWFIKRIQEGRWVIDGYIVKSFTVEKVGNEMTVFKAGERT